MAEVKIAETRKSGVVFFELKNEELRVEVTNLGCAILSIYAKDRDGKAADVLLGYENIEEGCKDSAFLGAFVGRVANRIGGAAFDLNGKHYTLAANNGPNHLHGGNIGFNQKLFDYEIVENGVRFSYLSPDMEEGYPGNLNVTVTYILTENTLKLVYHAVSDADTLINLTNHAYFNLSGCGKSIEEQELYIDADKIACADENVLVTGEFLDVTGTPFDFRKFHEIGERINEPHEQLINGGGYDHAFMLNGKENQVILRDREVGRQMTISTDLPSIQVYSGNFLAGGCPGKGGKAYKNREGVALETQFLPNSIHVEEEPKAILRAKEAFDSVTALTFTQC